MPTWERLNWKNDFFSTTGTINGEGQSVVLECRGSSSGTITLNGTFVGVLRFVGAGTVEEVTFGGRLAFRSGVGSLGSNVIENRGELYNREYRVVTGGETLVVDVVSWTSGSVDITMSASAYPSTIFINGPVRSSEEEAVRAGRAFLASTGNLPVAAANALFTVFENPVGSGVTVHLIRRLFGSNRGPMADPLEYLAYANPTFIPNILAFSANRFVSKPASLATFRYQVAPDAIDMGGIPASGEPIASGGFVRERDFEIILPPGNSVGFKITGGGNSLTQSVRISTTLEWYEEEYN